MKKSFYTLIIGALLFAFTLTPATNVAFATEATATKYEAESAVVNQAEKKYVNGVGSYAFGVSGTGFVGGIDYDTSSITFTVSVATEGTYEFFLKYATDTDNATLIVENYDAQSFVVNCSTKKGWGSFNSTPAASASIQLKEGEQTITVKKGNMYVELDYISIGDLLSMEMPEGEQPTSWDSKIEAENSLYYSGYVKKYGSSYSGSGFVGSLDHATSYVEFKVPCEEDGMYALKIRYATSGTRSATVYVGNYNKVGRYECYGRKDISSAGTWGEFSGNDVIFNVGLKAGVNCVRVYVRYVEIDYVEVSNKLGEFVAGSDASGNSVPELTADGYVKCR